MSSSDAVTDSGALVAALAARGPDALALADVQALVELAVLAHGRILDAETEAGPILPPHSAVTATDAARAASALLGAVNLAVFELALWESWGGRPWAAPQMER